MLTFEELLSHCTIEPPILPLNRSATFNQMGYVFYSFTPMTQAFIDNEAKVNHHVLEIGCGFGNVPLAFLKRGIAKYTAMDTEKQHLALLAKRLKEQCGQDDRITFLHGHAPVDLPQVKHTYDAILIDKVLHFLTPAEIEAFLNWAKGALKKGGRLYITTVSPHSKIYAEKVLPVYIENVQKNIPYPGYFEDTDAILDHGKVQNEHPNHHIPKQLTLFAVKELSELLANHKFVVSNAHFFVLGNEQDPTWYTLEESEAEKAQGSLGAVGLCAAYL
ncbi:MAG: class I SAM-dependent methyltransferase [Candidatus Berkiella sp.]